MHTIFALSSGHGRAGVAVIRISGPAAGDVLDRMAPPRPKPRFAAFRRIRHPSTGDLVDEALVLWFPAPRSETGEDTAELQVHGGPAVVRAVLAAIATIPGCRLAEPGEFARRAFENGRLDLTAVEGLADLIDAETEAQRRQALAQAAGALGRTYDAWRERLIAARALAEAAIDFSDEADVATDSLSRARTQARALASEIADHLAAANRGEIVRDGFRVVIAGPPNAGKSSLLNALARRDAAIVSPEPGTTRDPVEVRLDLGGYAVVVIDTAGIRDDAGVIEAEGIRRTLSRSRAADLVLWLVDATAPVWTPPSDLAAEPARLLTVVNKCDLVPCGPPAAPAEAPPSPVPASQAEAAAALPAAPLRVSARTGAGLAALSEHLAARVRARLVDPDSTPCATPPPTQARHRSGLEAAHAALSRLLAAPPPAPELQAEDLRLAGDALARLVGRIDSEDVLDQVFGRFCIGK